MRTTSHTRSGVALLEAIIALLLFGTVITTFLALTRQTLVTNAHARQAEAEMTDANRVMETSVLWPVADLVRHLGARPEGQFTVDIKRVTPNLFSLAISGGTAKVLLHTVIYRPCCGPEQ